MRGKKHPFRDPKTAKNTQKQSVFPPKNRFNPKYALAKKPFQQHYAIKTNQNKSFTQSADQQFGSNTGVGTLAAFFNAKHIWFSAQKDVHLCVH